MDNNTKENEKDPIHRIKLKRHLWPDELELRNTKRNVVFWKRIAVVTLVAGLGVGWLSGSFVPLPFTGSLRTALRGALGLHGDKVDAVKDIMENDWYFGEDIEDLDERLEDQAIAGMTTNEEDPHTEYMSKEENEAFVQSINRDYVGIGAEFIMHDNYPVVTRVFVDSPAEKAGLQAGDVIREVDGDDISGLSNDEISSRIGGDEGTDVTLHVERKMEEMDIVVTRGQVESTCYAEMLDEDLMYMRLYQFGAGTHDKMLTYFDDMVAENGNVKLILDLRGNGGGYLDSVQECASFFLDEGDIVMIQEFTDGSRNEIKALDDKNDAIHDIVILTDASTASAAEVMTLALKENRDDVTILGKTTYGKGTAQVSASFSDGSTLKYTASRWLSPDEEWINGTGITPDEEVDLPVALTISYPEMEEEVLGYDDVSGCVEGMQYILQYFGYDIDRTDGYFSTGTEAAWTAFEEDHDYSVDGQMDQEEYTAAIAEVIYDYAMSDAHDTQLSAAKEILNG